MTIKAQVAMVMNLDKCLGCHTCSVTCKDTWTNRPGAEYMYFNNVETKPGIGYPKKWEDQEKYKGGWELHNSELRLKSGTKMNRLMNLFYNPNQPTIEDYYEPWEYDYETLINSSEKHHQPVARPKSSITGEFMELEWGPNWEDDLAGGNITGMMDPNVKPMEQSIKAEFEDVFMMYLPRICEHCLNPSCVSACPSGAMYKRDEDGIVLVDQNACRGWRHCVSSCPYKKVYFNWQTNKAEKCNLCFPRIEQGLPTICSETCVGRVRYVGVMLYDAGQVKEAASAEDTKGLYHSQLNVFLDPHDPEVIKQAKEQGIPHAWIEAAQNSPVYKMVIDWKIALPLHPEYRTLPMVWYIPPLSPIMNGFGEKENDTILPKIDAMRIPIEYLANLLTAGDTGLVRITLKKLAGMRMYMRDLKTGKQPNSSILKELGTNEKTVTEMYRLLAIAKYKDRFVIPDSHREKEADLYAEQGACGLDFAGGPGSCGTLS